MDQDFLFGILAVQLGFVSPSQVMAAASAWLADPSKSMRDRLETDGALDKTKRAMLDALVTEALKAHGGNAQKALATLGGQQAVFRSFGGSVVADDHGKLSIVPADSPSMQADAADEVSLVTSEQPGRYLARAQKEDSAEIGRGGLGRVLLAFDKHLGREVAVKELLGDEGASVGGTPGTDKGSRTTPMVARFLREARVTGQLEHPNIVPVYEVGQRQNGTFYYAMRVVRGKTLADKLRQCHLASERLGLLNHYVNLCNAIAYAHSRGVIHRDIKPENVMIGEFGETVVLDWGLAKVRGKKDIRGGELERELKDMHDAGAGRTVDGSAIGTPAYMSPEQADGRIGDIDERSDVWGLGAVLYEILTGAPPYEGYTAAEILGKVLNTPVTPVAAKSPQAPPELGAVAGRALQHDKEKRYPSALELAQEVDAYLQGRRVRAYSYSSWDLVRRFVAANKALSAGVLAVLVTIAVSSVIIFLAYGREQRAHAATELQKQAALEQKRDAAENLAQAYLSKAEELVREREYGSAYVYAAAALREHQRLGESPPAESRVALDSALYEATVHRTLELERTLPGPSGDVRAMAFSSDGRWLAACDTLGTLWLTSVDGAHPVISKVGGSGAEYVRFSPDGASLMVGNSDGVLRTHSLDDLRGLATEQLHAGLVTGGDFSPDMARAVLASSETGAWLTFRGATQKPISLGEAVSAAFSPDGSQIARCTAAGAMVIHDGLTGKPTTTVQVSDKPVSACVFSADGKRVALATNDGPQIVDVARKEVVARLDRSHGANGAIVAAPGVLGWVIGGDKRAVLWSGEGSRPTEVFWEGSRPTVVTVSADGRHIATGQAGAVRIWSVRTTDRAVVMPFSSMPTAVARSADSRRAVVFADGRIYLVDIAAGSAPVLLGAHAPSLLGDVALSPNGRTAASVGADQAVKTFDLEARAEQKSKVLTRLAWPTGMGPSLEYSPDGTRVLVTSPDGRIHVLDASSLQVERILAANLGWPPALRCSADGRRLLAGDLFGQVAIWSVDGWRLERLWSANAGVIVDVAMSPDGKALISAGNDGWVREHSLETGVSVGGWRAHDVCVNRLAVSPDGKRLLTASDDRTVRLWDASTGKLLRILHSDSPVVAFAMSADGASLAMNGENALMFLPDLREVLGVDANALYDKATRSGGRELDGFGIVAILPPDAPTAPSTEEKKADAGAASPDELSGRVSDYFSPAKASPEGTTVELLDAEREEPLSPPLVATADKAGRVSFKVPSGVTEFVSLVRMGKDTTSMRSVRLRPGSNGLSFTSVPMDEARSLASSVHVTLDSSKGQIAGRAWWISPRGRDAMEPLGCVELSQDGGVKAYFAAPTPASRLHPDARLDRVHPGAPFFYLFNVEPGMTKLRASVGDAMVEVKVKVRAGGVSFVNLYFPADRFPTNPTPPRCLEDWPPAD